MCGWMFHKPTMPTMMRLPSISFVLLLLLAESQRRCGAFVAPGALLQPSSQLKQRHPSRQASLLLKAHRLHEFDHLLRETKDSSEASFAVSRHKIALGPEADGSQVVLAASSFAAPGQSALQQEAMEQTQQELSAGSATEQPDAPQGDSSDPYALDSDDGSMALGKVQSYQEQQQQGRGSFLESKLKNMDLQDIILTLVLPSIVAFAGLRWGYNRVAGRVQAKMESTLDAFAREMVYHDGDFEEMKLCWSDYSRKLLWMGPTKTDAMLKAYLQLYAKKKTVSPQAISSLSYVFSLVGLSEEKAANLLVSLCRQMGTDKISSAGKLLFLGSRILKTPEGKAALSPIKDLIKSTYREATVAEMMVETSQNAMAEASYRATVQAGGKNQETLTIGWEVLGLDRETAERIFNEEAKEGFVSARETMYGGQTTKYDKKGHVLKDDGTLENPEEADDDEDESEEGPVSNVYECSECGYTLFIAQGRESKFFGDSFTCPECGAPKDKFKARDDVEE